MFQNRSKLIKYAVFGVLLAIIASLVISYFTSTRTVTITTKNIASYSLSEDNTKESGKKITSPKTSIRIKKGKTYVVNFVGATGYETGSRVIGPESASISIDPDYSAEKIAQLLMTEGGAINAAIVASGTSIDTLYTIQPGALVHLGEWYFTTLRYKGSVDDQSSDTLVVGLQKLKGTWTAVLPPEIVFTTAAYPDVSRDFIDAANTYQNTHVTPTEE